jgi:hypothetical protein
VRNALVKQREEAKAEVETYEDAKKNLAIDE